MSGGFVRELLNKLLKTYETNSFSCREAEGHEELHSVSPARDLVEADWVEAGRAEQKVEETRKVFRAKANVYGAKLGTKTALHVMHPAFLDGCESASPLGIYSCAEREAR